jgi:predicted transcriptional regulator
MFDELQEMFESTTIKPSFEEVHIILALLLFGKNPEGIGRYKLKKNLSIGSGTARSLVNKLKEKVNFIKLVEDNKRKGHILTEKGRVFLKKVKKKLPILTEGDTKLLEEIIIEKDNYYTCFSLVKNGAESLRSGIEQRDAAIKVNGFGATCLVYDGFDLKFPSKPGLGNDEDLKLSEKVQNYFKTKILNENEELEKKDVILIGFGNDFETARLATLNAALSLLE